MAQNAPRLVSRAQLARYAGVSRAAVTNWRKRGPGFPDPADAERELFDLDQVTDWLSSRAVPANARQPHESAGTTYADRVRASAREEVPGHGSGRGTAAPERNTGAGTVEKSVRNALNRLRDDGFPTDGYRLLLDLVHMCVQRTEAWRELRAHVELRGGSGTLPQTVTASVSPVSHRVLGALDPERLGRTLTEIDLLSSGDEGRKNLVSAFDFLLSTWEEDRSAGIVRTPDSLVEAIVGLLVTDDTNSHIHDPFCRTGEFLVAADRHREAMSPFLLHRLSGAGGNTDQAHTARTNLAIHGAAAADLLDEAVEPGVPPAISQADLVITNPPFNQRTPAASARQSDRRFRYGHPPESNANFAWLQHAVAMLAPHGRAGVLMPTNAAFSEHQDERAIRSAMVEDGAVEGVVAFPGQLFPNTSIPVSLWLLRRPTGHCSEMLFIDAGDMGSMVSRTRRALLPQDIEDIHAVYWSWRRREPLAAMGRVAGIQEVRSRDYSLHPPSYVTASHVSEDTGDRAAERLDRLVRRLRDLEAQALAADGRARHLLQEVHRWIP
ncbi:N-6 DNA methylase [Nocardiopsis dassonvillei]